MIFGQQNLVYLIYVQCYVFKFNLFLNPQVSLTTLYSSPHLKKNTQQNNMYNLLTTIMIFNVHAR